MTTNHDAVTLTLKALARHFDERHEARAKLAAEAREDEPAEFPEQDAIARTWKNAADATWDLVGGRPGADDGGQHFIRIGLRELGKLVEMATHPLYVLHAPAAAPQPSENLGGFDEGLVERLCKLSFDIQFERDPRVRDMVKSWEQYPEFLKESGRLGMRAILTTLASMPCELPTASALRSHCVSDTQLWPESALEFVRARVAPLLAAKDAEIERLKATQDDSAAFDSDLATENRKLQERIAELETKLAKETAWAKDVTVANAECQRVIDKAHARIAKLEQQYAASEQRIAEYRDFELALRDILRVEHKGLAQPEELKRLLTAATTVQNDIEGHDHKTYANIVAERSRLYAQVTECQTANTALTERARTAEARIADLEKRLAEATAVPTVDGKTPGQVDLEAREALYKHPLTWENCLGKDREAQEAGAQAVLRVFGGEALRRVRSAFNGLRAYDLSGEPIERSTGVCYANVVRVVDDEFAKLGVNPDGAKQ